MNYSRDFIADNPDFRFLHISRDDGLFKRCLKTVASFLTSSIRFTVIHSSNIRTYISLGSSFESDTIARMNNTDDGEHNGTGYIQTLHTSNGTMISYLDVDMFSQRLKDIVQKWVNNHPSPKRNTHRDSGFYKKLLRVQILFDHVKNIYSDKYNVYQAAYIHDGYSFRAILCFIMQIVSVLALVKEPRDSSSASTRSLEDYVLMFITVLYMFFNIPANYATSNMSHSIILLNVFQELGMYSRMVFVAMDMIINTVLMSFLPIISARLLSGTTLSTEIVTRSLSVMFITSLDDNAVTKGESNRFSESQDSFLKDMVERIDQCRDSDRLKFIRYIPWIENFALLASVLSAYYILFA